MPWPTLGPLHAQAVPVPLMEYRHPLGREDSSADSSGRGPFSEERAYESRTHASDYLPGLSPEILNGGLKLPEGVP